MMPTTSTVCLARAENACLILEAAQGQLRDAEVVCANARQTVLDEGRNVFALYENYNVAHQREVREAIERLEAARRRAQAPLVVPDAEPFSPPPLSPIMLGGRGRGSPPPLHPRGRRVRAVSPPFSPHYAPDEPSYLPPSPRSLSPARDSGSDSDSATEYYESESDDDINEIAENVELYLDEQEALVRHRNARDLAHERAQAAVVNVIRERLMNRLDDLERDPDLLIAEEGLPIAQRLVRRIRGSYRGCPIDFTQ